jgi:SAM-dependent MidA family methyltransferase
MWVTWRAAMQEALYASHGFYPAGDGPAAHFRTSVHASPRFAAAVLVLLRQVDSLLGQPSRLDLVDIGAGRGELLTELLAMARRAPARHAASGPPQAAQHPNPLFPERIAACAVEIAARPEGLDRQIRWQRSVPSRITGLVIANEWLDNVPLDVVELASDGPRLVLVDTATGEQRPGPLAGEADQAWLRRWWPLDRIGDRAEIGRSRCAAWADVIGRLDRGVAVAADYGHLRAARPAPGTLAAYQDGRPVRPVPDGSRDITAHVAVDACAAAGTAAGAARTVLTSQRQALRGLGLRGARPPLAMARTDPAGYLAVLRQATQDAELTDPGGLGAFHWLFQAVRVPLPPSLGQHEPSHAAVTSASDTAVTTTGVTSTAATNTAVTNTGVTNTGVTNTGVTNTAVTNTGATSTGATTGKSADD